MKAVAAATSTMGGTRRPDGRAAFQQRKRQNNRAAILAAASRVFAETPYVHAKIEDIIREAGVSRATFYAHFESKLALAFAIYEDIMPEVDALFDRLPQLAGCELRHIKAWLQDYVGLYIEHRCVTPLLAQLQLFEESFRDRCRQDRDAHIRELGEAGVASFAAARGDSESALLQRARARLLLQRLTMVCAEVAEGEVLSSADAEAYLTLAAAELQTFLDQTEPHA